jgi:AbiV family abortive infection protein
VASGNADRWRAYGDACRDNGLDLKGSADSFENQGKIGRAYSFTVLAWEELAKCLIYRMAEIGLMSFDLDGTTAGALIRVDPHVLTRHREKHLVITLTLIGAEYVGGLAPVSAPSDIDPATVTAEQLAAITPEMIAERFPEKIRPTRMRDIPKEMGADEPFKVRVRALTAERAKWDDMKNRGLYVGVGQHGPEIPSGIARSDLDSLKELFGQWYTFNAAPIQGFPPAFLPHLRKLTGQLYSPAAVGLGKVFFCYSCAGQIRSGRMKLPPGVTLGDGTAGRIA